MVSLSLMATLVAAAHTAAAAATAYSPFVIKPLTTHQPIGNNEGETNFYSISFTVSSCNGAEGANSTATCQQSWADNSWAQSADYSLYVPTGEWIACGQDSEFSFQLFPYFAIGNFTLAVQQNFTDVSTGSQTLASGALQVTNTTSQYTCDINPAEVKYIQHAHGDCSIPTNGTAFAVPVTSSSVVPVCGAAANVTAAFEATYDVTAGQSVLVVGSIPELGSWDPSKAVPMQQFVDSSAPWAAFKAAVDIPAGTGFEYKYLLQDTDGSETWECCENRVGSIAAGTCGDASVSSGPDYFRGGGYPVES